MELRRCVRGTGSLAVLLIATGLILDDTIIFLAGSTILAGLVLSYLRFNSQSRGTVRSVVISRSLGRNQIRKGTTTTVSADITLRVPPRMQVTVTEILPAGVGVQDGATSFEMTGSPFQDTCRLRYRITPLVHGTLAIRGISLTIRDVFFETSFSLTAERFGGPALFVQPRGAFESMKKHSVVETREIEKMSVTRGFGIRSLREYYAGDNIRNIDWKLSAKHEKLVVREYTGVVSLPPVLVVDLPWSGLPFSAPDFDRMVAGVAGMAENSVRNFQYITLILISGTNILQVIEEEKGLRQGMVLLREWLHPAERVIHGYRITDRSGLREQIRHLEHRIHDTGDERARSFFTMLQMRYLTVLPHLRSTVFSTDIARVLTPISADQMVIFTLGEGDLSHLRQIILQAKLMKFGVHLRVPAPASALTGPSFPDHLGADSMEAFS